ncbi:MAG: N-acetylmuramoyl-L-alanine amidase [Caulobacteraceae bacterium]|nr:N-acetylmuramoyl-L-alanine amidase [Caulobacteraceae bacterium]
MPYLVDTVPAQSQGGVRPQPPEVIVLHHTGSTGSAQSQIEYLRSNPRGVSIHVIIAKDGRRTRMVIDERIAYHVGYSVVGSLGNRNANAMSLGIEIMNSGSKNLPDPYPHNQVDSVAEQVALWLKKFPTIQMITPHAGIDTQGKYDPYAFPWDVFWRLLSEYMRG